jgi:hypothetical protein
MARSATRGNLTPLFECVSSTDIRAFAKPLASPRWVCAFGVGVFFDVSGLGIVWL